MPNTDLLDENFNVDSIPIEIGKLIVDFHKLLNVSAKEKKRIFREGDFPKGITNYTVFLKRRANQIFTPRGYAQAYITVREKFGNRPDIVRKKFTGSDAEVMKALVNQTPKYYKSNYIKDIVAKLAMRIK